MQTRRTFPGLGAPSRWGGSLTKKASLNALAAGLEYAARLVVGFVINPLLVRGLGDYGFGAWQILGRLAGYVTPASGRPTQALKWTIANKQASTDYKEKRHQVGSAIAVWLLFCPLMVLLGGLLAWFAPAWLDAPADFVQIIRLTAAVLVINLIVTSVAEVPRSVLMGENLAYKLMGLSALLVLTGGGLTALALYLDRGLVGVAMATLVTTLLSGLLILRVARKHIGWFGIARPPLKSMRWFLGLSGWFIAWNLIMRLMRTSDVVILGLVDSVELVTSYTLTKYVPETLISIVAIIVFGVTPGLGGIIGSGDLRKAARVRSEIMVFSWLLVTAVGATTVMWNQSFIQLWVGSQYYAGPVPTLLIVAMVAQFVLIRNDANIIDLTLNLRHKVMIGALSVVLAIAAAWVLLGTFDMGITGLCLGFIAGRCVLSLGYPWLIGRYLGCPLPLQLRSSLRPALMTAVLFGLTLSLHDVWTASTWGALIIDVGLTVAVVSVAAFYLGLSAKQRGTMMPRIRTILSRAKS